MRIPEIIENKRNKYLYLNQNHPIGIIKNLIDSVFEKDFSRFDKMSDVVSVEDNFDKLLIPKEHPSRRKQDTFYLSENEVLRTHTSAHQNEILSNGIEKFLVCGDVFRRDSIDKYHYPVFHQMEGVCICENPKEDLHFQLKKIVNVLFGNVETRITDSYFPFTEPSWEYEILYQGSWLEILGCGQVHSKILENCGYKNKKAWAFGLGLERLAMVLFGIPDIRLFWSEDKRFISQFEEGIVKKFIPYSIYPSCYKDISFWITNDFSYNGFCDLIRDIGGDLIENVSLLDEFKKENKISQCYRIVYCSMDRNLTNEEINNLQSKIREKVVSEFNVELR